MSKPGAFKKNFFKKVTNPWFPTEASSDHVKMPTHLFISSKPMAETSHVPFLIGRF